MRKPKDLSQIQNLLITIKSYLKTNVAVVILGKDIALHDFTHDRTLVRKPCDNQGLESFIFQLGHIKTYLYVLWSSSHGFCDFEKLRPAIEFFNEKYGFIPKI